MPKKIRVYKYLEKRNGILAAALGDKSYKEPELSPDFYKKPGLIVGSTNKDRKKSNWKKTGADLSAFYTSPNSPTNSKVLLADRIRQEIVKKYIKGTQEVREAKSPKLEGPISRKFTLHDRSTMANTKANSRISSNMKPK